MARSGPIAGQIWPTGLELDISVIKCLEIVKIFNQWNSLLPGIMGAPSLKHLKKILDSHFSTIMKGPLPWTVVVWNFQVFQPYDSMILDLSGSFFSLCLNLALPGVLHIELLTQEIYSRMYINNIVPLKYSKEFHG